MENLTAIIKAFLRDEYLFECYRSLKIRYPELKVIIADDSLKKGERFGEEKLEWIRKVRKNGDKFFKLPYDSGICVGRNRILDRVRTDFVLIGDDDFQYDNNALVDWMYSFMIESPEYDLIGGRIFENGGIRNYQGDFVLREGEFVYKAHDLASEYRNRAGLRYWPCDLTFNYFVARTEACRAVRWDERIKVAYEHSDFFIRFRKAGFRAVFSPDPLVTHKPKCVVMDPVKRKEYLVFRQRISDKRRFFTKHKLRKCTDMHGHVVKFNPKDRTI